MEIKHFNLHDVKADEAARTIEGWASTFGNADSDNDIIAPGAFVDSIRTKMPKMLWQHRTDQVIGVWNEANETPQGLYVKGTILDTTLGEDAYKLAKAGAIDSMSIGFTTQKYIVDRENNTRTIQSVKLWEVSLVTFPANEMARIMGVKSKPETERDLEKFLRDAGYSRQEAKTIVAGGFKALGSQREAENPELETLSKLFNKFKV